MLSCMCPDRTQYRHGSPDASDVTRCGTWAQDAQDKQDKQDKQDAEPGLGESGRNTTVSDADYLFADEFNLLIIFSSIYLVAHLSTNI